MRKVNRILTFLLVMAIVLSMLIVPAAAATRYVPRCWYCNSTRLVYVDTHEYEAEGTIYYIENEYRCRDCGKTTFIDVSLLN